MICHFCGKPCNRDIFTGSKDGRYTNGRDTSRDGLIEIEFRISVTSCQECAVTAKNRMMEAIPVGRGGGGCLSLLVAFVGIGLGLVCLAPKAMFWTRELRSDLQAVGHHLDATNTH